MNALNRILTLTICFTGVTPFARGTEPSVPIREFSDAPNENRVRQSDLPEGTLEIQKIPPEMEKKPAEQPWFVRWMVHPRPRGMFLNIPVVDTDPNRGATAGIMPIWVIQDEKEDRIRKIYAPSFTRNRIFKWDATYRYYYYPSEHSTLALRADYAQVVNQELFAEYEDFNFLSRNTTVHFKLQKNIDGSYRFFGIGPNTPKSGESNYVTNYLEAYGLIGHPFSSENRWSANGSYRITGQAVANGPINRLPDIGALYPQETPAHRHQVSASRLSLNYDSRDSPITTTQGTYWDLFGETSQRELASEYTYNRYGTDLRKFYKLPQHDRWVTAAHLRFEQIIGEDRAPFWLMPELGGKYSSRAYGEGRYIDKGLLSGDIEERFTFADLKEAGVQTRFELAPFVGLGTVFDHLSRVARRYARPVYGVAVRAVAPPQVVGSIDFGIGQEGLAAFTDINYSF